MNHTTVWANAPGYQKRLRFKSLSQVRSQNVLRENNSESKYADMIKLLEESEPHIRGWMDIPSLPCELGRMRRKSRGSSPISIMKAV